MLGDLSRLTRPNPGFAPTSPAPILTLAHVFEPELCAHLIDCFEHAGGKDSGFMQDVSGRSVENFDNSWKRRRDFHLTDPALIANLRARIGRRICPEIKKAFQMRPTRIERDLVACYDAETGGHFGPHRDDTGIAIAHRRFAVSINLNADFEGGEISFPEYSPRTFKAAPGTAVVFSASILHQVSRVTRGRRYVFLTFLFDEEAERVRQVNLRRHAGGATSASTDQRVNRLVAAPELGRTTPRSPLVVAHQSPNQEVRQCGRRAPWFRSRSE